MAASQPSESDLNAFGNMLAGSAFGGPALGFTLLGMQIFMVFYGLSSFLSMSRRERQGRLRFVVISYTILLTSSTSIALDAWGGCLVLFRGGPDGQSYIQANVDSWGASQTSTLIGDALGWITILQGDALMLWRCFVLWGHKKWLVILPLLTCIGATACVLAGLLPISSWKGDYMSPDRLKPIVAGIAMSVAANIMITCLIVSRLVMTWKDRGTYFPDQTGPNIYSGVIAIVIESAAPLALFGICLVITVALARIHPTFNLLQRGQATTAADFFNWLYSNGFCALSPQMIIFRVTTGRSWRSSKENSDRITALSKPIAFAPPLGSAESQSSATIYVI